MKSGYKKGERKFQSFEWVTITTNQSQCASTRMSTRHIPCLFPVKFIFPHNFHAQRPVSLKLYMKKWQRNANRTRNQTGEEKKIFSYGSLKAFSHQRLNGVIFSTFILNYNIANQFINPSKNDSLNKYKIHQGRYIGRISVLSPIRLN